MDPHKHHIFYTADQIAGLVHRLDRKERTIERIAGVPRPRWHGVFKMLIHPSLDWGNGGPAIDASLDGPRAPAVHPRTGDIYIPEHGATLGGHFVRKIDAATGIITIVAGAEGPGLGGSGCSGEGIPALKAHLHMVSHILFHPRDDNIMLFCESFNHVVRR